MPPPTLVSSSVSGPIIAPKAPVRRKRGPPATANATPTTAATPASAESAPTSVAPPTPPTTQQAETPISNPEPESTVESTFAIDHVEQARAPSQPAETPQEQQAAVREQQPPTEQQQEQSTTEEQRPTSNNEAPEQQDAELPDIALPPQSGKRKAVTQETATAPTRQPKRVKRSSARSNASVQAQINEDDAPVRPTAAPVETPQTPASTTSNERRAASTTANPRQPPKRKAPRKSAPKSAATIVDSDEEHETEADTQAEAEEEGDRPRKRRKRASKAKPRRRKTPRQTRTPAESGEEGRENGQGEDEDSGSDPELYEIDPQQITMFGISHEKRRGKTSEREKKMAAIDWNEVARKRFEELEAAAAAAAAGTTDVPTQPVDVRETTEGPSGTAESRNSVANETPAPTSNEDIDDGPSAFRIVDGQIVADDSQLVIDRHAQAQEEAAETGVAVVEDNDLTRRVNQMTYVNARRRDVADRVPLSRRSDPWTEEDTDRFYDALRRFGTDFYIISKMFAPRTRKQIKTKFNREEKIDGARITAALLGKVTGPTMNGVTGTKFSNAESYNLEFYAEQTGRDVADYTKYEGLEDVERVIRDSMKEKEAAMHEVIREENENQASLKAAEAMKEKGKKKREPRGKGRKKKVGGGGIGGGDDGGD